MDRSQAARLLGQIPKQRRYERTCPICGKSFMTTARGVYCSHACRVKALRARVKQKAKETEEEPGTE